MPLVTSRPGFSLIIHKYFLIFLFAVVLLGNPTPALSWGDKGHEVIVLIAGHYLDPAVRARLDSMLAADSDNLTEHDAASEATWADKINKTQALDVGKPREPCASCEWHFVNIEIANPHLDVACGGHPTLPIGIVSSRGPLHDCIVDKLKEFDHELIDPATSSYERLLALKYVLHLVGDLHQPLHVADDHDAGGNRKVVLLPHSVKGNLHFYWDVSLVDRLGTDPAQIAGRLVANISEEQRRAWSRGSFLDWTWDTFRLARAHAYGLLPAPNAKGIFVLPDTYLQTSLDDAALQLSKAGVRLAVTLNRALH